MIAELEFTEQIAQETAPLYRKVASVIPEIEWPVHAPYVAAINRLKKQRNAVVLAHAYQTPEIFHCVADITGDSLALSKQAVDTEAEVIVFAGVHFMAETAKLLNPERVVLIPDEKAGCSLAESISADDVKGLRAKHPGVPVVTYVNTSAAVKAEADVCCTSGNAKAVMESFDSDTIIFLPDEYLASNIAAETGKRIIVPKVLPGGDVQYDTNGDYDVIGWHGRCEVHEQFTVEDVANVRAQFPDVTVLSHPECSPEVVAASDYSGSTSGMIRFVQESNAARYLVLTECAMGDNIAAENPDKEMLRLCMVRCPHMNQITLEDTRDALKYMRYQIEVPEDVRVRALGAVERMLAIG